MVLAVVAQSPGVVKVLVQSLDHFHFVLPEDPVQTVPQVVAADLAGFRMHGRHCQSTASLFLRVLDCTFHQLIDVLAVPIGLRLKEELQNRQQFFCKGIV